MAIGRRQNWLFNTLHLLGKIIFMAIALVMCCSVYGTKVEPNWIEVVPLQLTLTHLSPAFEGLKLVHISDLHADRYMPSKRLNRIINLVNQQQPDVIAITGDFVSKYKSFNSSNLEQALSKLVSQDVTLAVLGNHDRHHQKTAKIRQLLAKSKIIDLNNQVYWLQRGTETLAFAGIDDPYYGQPDLPQVLNQLSSEEQGAILLVHEPDFIDISASTNKFDLQLSGHSHGGQIKFPWLKPSILPPGGKKYPLGLNRVNNTIEYTNRGLGMTGVPIRFSSRPEITVITLHSKQ